MHNSEARTYRDVYQLGIYLLNVFDNLRMVYVHLHATKHYPSTTLDTADTFRTRHFGQSCYRNRGSWRDGANNRDWLSFRRYSAWPIIFSYFVRRPEDPPECWPMISSEVGQLRRPSYIFLLLLYRFLSLPSERRYNPTIHISCRHTIATSVTLRGQYLIKKRGEVVPLSLRCGVLYIKISPEFRSPYRRPSIAEERKIA